MFADHPDSEYRLVAVGFCEEHAVLDNFLGLGSGTWGYHSDDGSFFTGRDMSGVESGSGPQYGQKYGGAGTEPDVIGCGVNFQKKTAFFTHNGEHLGEYHDFHVLGRHLTFPS